MLNLRCYRKIPQQLVTWALLVCFVSSSFGFDNKRTTGMAVFTVDDKGQETELKAGFTFVVEGTGGPGTRVSAKFDDATAKALAGKILRLKRSGVVIAETVMGNLPAAPTNTPAGNTTPPTTVQTATNAEKQAVASELQKIHLKEWKDLQELHEEEIGDLQKRVQAPELDQDTRDKRLAEFKTALARHENDRTNLETQQKQERNNVLATLFGRNGAPAGSDADIQAMIAQLPDSSRPTTGGGTTTGGAGRDIAGSVESATRGKFRNFLALPTNPLNPATASDPTPPITGTQEDAAQAIVRAVWVIGHFDHIAQHTENVWAGAPTGAATPAGGREVSDFPIPSTATGSAVMHPSLRNGGTAIEFPKFVRELLPMVIARPVAVSSGPLNTEELRRGYSPAAWGQIGVGQVKHGIAPEYWQHPADWDTHPTHFYELTSEAILFDVLGVGIMTPLWGYNGHVPGDAFFGRDKEPFVVRNINNLAHDRSCHLHGGHSPSHSDGSPHFTITPGNARDYYYPNIAPRLHDRNLDILERTAQTGEDYMTAAAALNIPIYISKEGPAPQGDDPPGGWPAEADGNPARIQRVLGPLGGVAGDEFDHSEFSDTLWYHDHGMDETGPAAYSGLAGTYTLTDDIAEEHMRKNILPSVYPKIGEDANGVAQSLDFDVAKRGGPETDYNKYFVHMCISDKVFNPDGTLFYDTLSHDGQMGDVMVVNGYANPKFTVEKRKYRFSILNHGNARATAYQMRTADHRMAQPFMQIGYDTWLYPKPITQDFMLGMPAKRMDVIIDFKELADRGIREVYLENILPQIDGRGPRGTGDISQLLANGTILKDGEAGEQIVKFIITDEPVHGGKPDLAITMDTELRPHLKILPEEVVKTRVLSFHREQGAWKINGVFFDTNVGNVTPTVGTAERWIVRNNGGGWWHPVHIHLEAQQWQKINGKVPALRDQFKQDIVLLGSGDEVELFMKFRTWLGSMVFHCHNLEHEDMRMMFNMDSRLVPTEAPQQTQNVFP